MGLKDYTRWWGAKIGDALLDLVTGSIRTISSDHSSIHNGKGFNAWVFAEGVADDGFVQLEFKTAATRYVHMKVMAGLADGLAAFTAVEAPTLTTGNTAFVPVNLNRVGTPTASTSVLKTNPTSISEGTIIRAYYLGGGTGGNANGGADDKDIEIVLKPATTYLFRVQNLAGSAKALSLWLFWYEEDTAGVE